MLLRLIVLITFIKVTLNWNSKRQITYHKLLWVIIELPELKVVSIFFKLTQMFKKLTNY